MTLVMWGEERENSTILEEKKKKRKKREKRKKMKGERNIQFPLKGRGE